MHSLSACSRLTEKKELSAYASFCSVFEGEILERASLLFSFAKGYAGFPETECFRKAPVAVEDNCESRESHVMPFSLLDVFAVVFQNVFNW